MCREIKYGANQLSVEEVDIFKINDDNENDFYLPGVNVVLLSCTELPVSLPSVVTFSLSESTIFCSLCCN